MLLGDLRQAHTGAAISNHLIPVYIKPRSPDLPTFQTGTAHTRPHALDDDAPLKLSHGARNCLPGESFHGPRRCVCDVHEMTCFRRPQPIGQTGVRETEVVSWGRETHPPGGLGCNASYLCCSVSSVDDLKRQAHPIFPSHSEYPENLRPQARNVRIKRGVRRAAPTALRMRKTSVGGRSWEREFSPR